MSLFVRNWPVCFPAFLLDIKCSMPSPHTARTRKPRYDTEAALAQLRAADAANKVKDVDELGAVPFFKSQS